LQQAEIGKIEKIMEDQDILKIRKILQNKKRNDLADLLRYSRSYLNVSSRFGSYMYSTLSIFRIFSPLKQNEELTQLSEQDREEIYRAVLLIYPHKEESPEIICIEYEVDFELGEIELVETNELERVNFEHIHEQLKKCENKITEKDYEGAVTNSRTLLESVCWKIME
jgi:hypothetical protein